MQGACIVGCFGGIGGWLGRCYGAGAVVDAFGPEILGGLVGIVGGSVQASIAVPNQGLQGRGVTTVFVFPRQPEKGSRNFGCGFNPVAVVHVQDKNRERGFGTQGFVTNLQNFSSEQVTLEAVAAAGHGWGRWPRLDGIGLALDPNGANFAVGLEEGIAGHNQVGVVAGGNGSQHRIHAEEACGGCGQGGQGIVKGEASDDGFADSGRERVHFVQTVGGEGDGDAGFAQQSGIGRGLVPMDQGAQAHATGLDGIAEVWNLRKAQGQHDGATQGPYGVQVHVLLPASFVDKRAIEFFGNSFGT